MNRPPPGFLRLQWAGWGLPPALRYSAERLPNQGHPFDGEIMGRGFTLMELALGHLGLRPIAAIEPERALLS